MSINAVPDSYVVKIKQIFIRKLQANRIASKAYKTESRTVERTYNFCSEKERHGIKKNVTCCELTCKFMKSYLCS